jgi:hypothetical protein
VNIDAHETPLPCDSHNLNIRPQTSTSGRLRQAAEPPAGPSSRAALLKTP